MNDHEEIQDTCCGRFRIPPWARAADLSLLTERELEVLAALGDCHSNTVIAGRLRITERTVKKHVTSVFVKLEITSRAEAAVIAIFGKRPPWCP
ncbi:response regulator transcription factor [Streptomyces sp. NPDC058479]|uniref:response regulator transcription factor n=2 Tax=Streptomyces TaxID=1883 RepID=UPI0036512F6C